MSNRPYAAKKFTDINGTRMAYMDEGAGASVVFQHGNPTSSYLWRNVMPHLEGQGRLIACDLVGMGDSGKLSPSGPDRYHYDEQRDHLFALWDHLALGDDVILVLHDWGSALGFDWAYQNQHRVAGIVYMEALVAPLTWSDWPEASRRLFQGFRSEAGDQLILENNSFVERVLLGGTLRSFDEDEKKTYRAPYLEPGESRRPTLTWPRNIPIDGTPHRTTEIFGEYSAWLARSEVPKLFVNAEPGAILTGRLRDHVRTWPNQTEVTVPGVHFVPEESPHEVGKAVSEFVRRLRGI
ncbi:haloalkane dehalogenase [Streptomyces rubiginosohelvolus]|uniref:Haloalkane dehalogenase n=1 Tax=Streptomyces rubiginosohelvolus TaxID=67362 RepID=A0ABW6EY43_9ACTN